MSRQDEILRELKMRHPGNEFSFLGDILSELWINGNRSGILLPHSYYVATLGEIKDEFIQAVDHYFTTMNPDPWADSG